MKTQSLPEVIDSLDSRHHSAQAILHSLAEGKSVKPADIDALDSKFVQVAPLLHALNQGNRVSQDDIDALDSFSGQRLRRVLSELSTGAQSPQTIKQRVSRKNKQRVSRKK